MVSLYLSYTQAVKTAISVPDPIFEAAEELAERLGTSRSQLYTKAVAAYVQAHRQENVTEALNRVYAEQPSELDPAVARLQWESIPREEW